MLSRTATTALRWNIALQKKNTFRIANVLKNAFGSCNPNSLHRFGDEIESKVMNMM